MRALHVFPIFGSDLVSGSEYYEFMLSRHLADLGVEVEVFATRSRVVHPIAAFALEWRNEFAPTESQTIERGLPVSRFSAPFRIPTPLAHVLSRKVLDRWATEDGRRGRMLEGSRLLPDHLFDLAKERPRVYDWLTNLGRGPISLAMLAALRQRISDVDVVLVGFLPFALVPQVVDLAVRHHKPVVVLGLFHPNDRYHYFASFFRAFERASCVLLQTDFVQQFLARVVPSARTMVIGAGVDIAELDNPSISGARFRERYGLKDAPLLLYVGRKERGKRYDVAVRAIDCAALSDARLVMIGREVDPAPIASDRVLYLGERPREEVLDAYDACDAFILPSEHESFGIVLLEAWMRRKPVLVNRTCFPLASVISEGVDGWLCHEPEEYAAAFERLIADHQLATLMGAEGRRKVLARYTWEHIARRVHGLYEDLTRQDRRRQVDRSNRPGLAVRSDGQGEDAGVEIRR